MRVLCIGDLHCREIWKDIVNKESYDKVIFLGDYTCPKEVKITSEETCIFLKEILEFKESNPNNVILLRGNHDCSELFYWGRCYPQDNLKVYQYWQTVKDRFIKDSQWIYQIPDTNIVCSHAGISVKFLEEVERYLANNMMHYNPFKNIPDRYKWILDNINNIEPCEIFAFTPCKMSDYNGESATQPCTWIRPYTLLQYGYKDIIHIVGHTPIKYICNIKNKCIEDREKYNIKDNKEVIENYCNIWCCDNLSNNEYLIIDNNKFIVKTYGKKDS